MFGKHVSKKLSAYCNQELSADEAREVAEHVLVCQRCRRELEEVRLGVRLAQTLPVLHAPASLLGEMETHLDERASHPAQTRRARISSAFTWPRMAVAFTSLLIAIALGGWFFLVRPSTTSWEVARIAGAPRIDSANIGESGRLAVGEWLETDANSRALVQVGQIGRVEIDPNTRVRLVETRPTEHRLALARGRMHASIWAPPRLFFVDTPSARATDLGCAYTLEVDDAGAGVLHVTVGWVALDLGSRSAIVPAGASCAMRKGTGPGTPYYEDATEAFRTALAKLDFEQQDAGARSLALASVLDEARPRDALTLWHLLSRTPVEERARAYDRLASLVPPPEGVTREGVLRLDQHMLDLWRDELKLGWFKNDPLWRRAWRWIWGWASEKL
ncbi:MAG TPA: FecR domain-containing protein [Pyrinomonadaceae bacterium]|nr:FecR domain-containing protein [Pyrinomonadaceae bacterium]